MCASRVACSLSVFSCYLSPLFYLCHFVSVSHGNSVLLCVLLTLIHSPADSLSSYASPSVFFLRSFNTNTHAFLLFLHFSLLAAHGVSFFPSRVLIRGAAGDLSHCGPPGPDGAMRRAACWLSCRRARVQRCRECRCLLSRCSRRLLCADSWAIGHTGARQPRTRCIRWRQLFHLRLRCGGRRRVLDGTRERRDRRTDGQPDLDIETSTERDDLHGET